MKNYEYNYINRIRENVIPDAHKKHYGSYMSFDDKKLSPGCMACKTGGWLCVFIGNRCNCTCPNCPNPTVNKGEDISVASGVNGTVDIDRILSLLEKSYYKGVGVSGGEPLLYMDKLVDWVTKIKAKFPNIYVWNYTNGIYATEENLKRLADAGLDEIRFDLAADNYSDLVLNNMKLATEIIPSVGIEVPVILEQYNDLIKAVDFADKCGVKYLNLHDIFVNEKMYKNGLGGHVLFFDKISKIQRDIFSSEMLIYKVFRHIKDNELNIVPNDCTLINMQLQTFGMRYQNLVDEVNKSISFDKYIDKMLESYSDDELLIERI
ncbi:MAG: radical SAM protein [Bacteroidetes bacterium]|nr:radical SAM protein [Bacteroidota bacterium]